MAELRNLSVLLIDPSNDMRSNLQGMLNLCGLSRIEHANGSGPAIRQLQARKSEIILCEYDLGNGQDGQQLLEDLRHNNIIGLSTIFFIVTAERAFEKVVSAAELAPTDYLLKPFTPDALRDRIVRAIEKRSIFDPVHRLMARGDLQAAIKACLAGELAEQRYATDFKRLRAELHVTLGEAELAQPLYAELVAQRAVAWARLGLGKTMMLQNKPNEAQTLLTALVEENPKFMAAHDWLAKAHAASGDLAAAKEVLGRAVVISPNSLGRLRKLGEVAFESGDIAAAEKAFQQVVKKARYSEFRDPEDHVRLVTTLIRKGDTVQAATVIRDLDKSLSDSAKGKTCHAMSSAMLFSETGDAARAAAELARAVEACRDSTGLSTEMKIVLAKNCLAHQLEDGATEVMLEVMNNASNSAATADVMRMFEQAGRPDLATRTETESRRIVVELVSSGAEKARQGDYRGAVTLMMEAVKKLPENPQVVFNAAVAVLKYLDNLGWDPQLGERARLLVDKSRRLDAANPRLASLVALHQEILNKYGIDTAAIPVGKST